MCVQFPEVMDRPENLHRRLVHFSKLLLVLADSPLPNLADVATHMNNELVGRVHVLGRERAPRSFAVAMTSEIHRRERESDFEVVDTIIVLMRYFEHFFEHELGDSMLQ